MPLCLNTYKQLLRQLFFLKHRNYIGKNKVSYNHERGGQMNKLKLILIGMLTIITVFPQYVNAKDKRDFQDRETYYLQYCQTISKENKEDINLCEEFSEYLSDKKKNYESQLTDMKNNEEQIKKNIEDYINKVDMFNKEIENLNEQVDILEKQNSSQLRNIEKMNDDFRDDIEQLEKKKNNVKDKLVSLQNSSQNLQLHDSDLSSFSSMSITKSNFTLLIDDDLKIIESISNKISSIADERNAQVEKSDVIEKRKQELQDNKALIEKLKKKSSEISMEYKRQEANLMAKKIKKVENLEDIKSKIRENEKALASLTDSISWINPIEDDKFELSAGVWHYPESFGGGLHLGLDFAASEGTEVKAPANGIILFSANNCTTNGGLGNACGAPGAWGGGNQTALLVQKDDSMFAITFFHFQYASVKETGTIISQGERIGIVGSTGNSTGGHTHVEVHYLGKGHIEDYASSWDGDLSFKNNWGDAALNNICGTDLKETHCRVDPREFFPMK